MNIYGFLDFSNILIFKLVRELNIKQLCWYLWSVMWCFFINKRK